MGLFEILDRILCGEEALNRWKNQRENSGFKSVEEKARKNYIKEETEEEALKRELDKYNHGHLFKLDQVPEIIQNKFALEKKKCESWGTENIQKVDLYSKFESNEFLTPLLGRGLCPLKAYSIGVEYVKNEQGEERLRVFKERRKVYSHS